MEKQKPRTNPRAGSSERSLWDPDLDWYFNEFESLCGLQSIGTSGAGQNQLRPPTEEEKRDRRERIRNGFLLTLPEHAKADAKSVSPGAADRAAFMAMAHGVFKRGRRIWRRLTGLPYSVQSMLRRAYEERIPEAGVDWGRPLLTDEQVRWAHRWYCGEEPGEEPARVIAGVNAGEFLGTAKRKPWKNPEPLPRYLFASLENDRSDDHSDDDDDEILDVVEFMERGVPDLHESDDE